MLRGINLGFAQLTINLKIGNAGYCDVAAPRHHQHVALGAAIACNHNLYGLKQIGYFGDVGVVGGNTRPQPQFLYGGFGHAGHAHADGVAVEHRLAQLPADAHRGREWLLGAYHPAVLLVGFQHNGQAVDAAHNVARLNGRGGLGVDAEAAHAQVRQIDAVGHLNADGACVGINLSFTSLTIHLKLNNFAEY